MTLDVASLFSTAGMRLRASEIRELLKLLNRPQMISFAGGLPNPKAFPMQELREVVQKVMTDFGAEALQYGPTEGHHKLRNAIGEGMGEHLGAKQDVENILVTAGSQQALQLLCTILLDPGDTVITASPTYLGALLTFNAASARVVGVPIDSDGMLPDALEAQLSELAARRVRPKMLYLVPTFDNPTSTSMSLERRKQIYALACRYDLLIVEDDPYGLLRFEGEVVQPIKALDVENRVAYLGSFSKILAPGFRVGWLAGPLPLVRKAVLAKQAQDLCTNTFGQHAVFGAMRNNVLFPHIENIKALYRHKRDLMMAAIEKHFPAEVQWNRPEGGMFLWVRLPDHQDSLELLSKAIDHDVAFVTGKPFYPDGSGQSTLRLNFSYAEDDRIDEGIARLGQVIRTDLDASRSDQGQDHVGIF
jgi:2-aminoadipate transaminase